MTRLKYREPMTKWQKEHPEQTHKIAHEWKQRLKIEVFKAYSPELKCQNPNCAVPGGMKDVRALSIDHIQGGGCKERRERGASFAFYMWLKENNFPSGYQVLCMNCQFIKRSERKEYSC